MITLSVMIPTLIEVLDTSVANVALDHIRGSLSAGRDEATWVLTSYMVANAVIIPMSGWLSRLMGRKRYLLASIAVFTVSSLLCGMATSLAGLVGFRILQGIGGGGLQPLSQAILLESYPREKRGLALAVFGIGVVMGPIFGPILGGYLTDNYSWHWIFFINLPIGILALWMNWAFVHDPPYLKRLSKNEHIDYAGLILLTLGMGCLQVVLDRGQQEDWFASSSICIMAVLAAVCLVALVWWELKTTNPILHLRLLTNRSFATGNVIMFAGFFAFFGSVVLLPLFLQELLGYTAFQAGLVLGPGGVLTLIFLPLVGRLTDRMDARIILGLGLVISGYSVFYMAGFNLETDMITAMTSRVIQGVSMPMFFVTISFLAMISLPKESMNDASSLFNMFRNLGGSFGTAFVTTMLARKAQVHQTYLAEHVYDTNPLFLDQLQQVGVYLSSQLGTWTEQSVAAAALFYERLVKQALVLAFNDTSLYQAAIFWALVLLVFFLENPGKVIQRQQKEDEGG